MIVERPVQKFGRSVHDAGLAGKTALVTGRNSGIGKVVAPQLAERSAHVILSGRRCLGRLRRDGLCRDRVTVVTDVARRAVSTVGACGSSSGCGTGSTPVRSSWPSGAGSAARSCPAA